MHPFFSSTRASMISWPTTNCRCSSGLRSSNGTVLHGMYWSAAGRALRFVTTRLAAEFELAARVRLVLDDLDLVFFAMKSCADSFLSPTSDCKGNAAIHNPLYTPPSTSTVWPVTYEARSEASQTM